MDLAPWKIMVGLTILLVILATVASLGSFTPVDIVVGVLFVGSILAAMYLGWRIGKTFRV